MQFNNQVIKFDFCGIPMVGNLNNGYSIGLNEAGAAVCERLIEEDVPAEEIAAVDEALFEHLNKAGFFTEKEAEPEAKDRVQSAYLHVTQRCNLNCIGCYSLDDGRNRLSDAPTKDIKHAIDGLASVGITKLVISGGEPFLRDDLPEIVRHAKESCHIADVTVLSNGLCITSEALSQMAPYVDCVSVSFDGWSAECFAYIRKEQHFDDLVAAIKLIQEAGIAAHMIPTVHAQNIKDLPEYVRLAKELGVTMNFSLLTCKPDDSTLGCLLPREEGLRQLGRSLLTLNNGEPVLAMDAPVGLNLTAKRNCGAGYKTLSVAADGTIYPCHMLHRMHLSMGNAFTGTIQEALKTKVSEVFRSLNVEEHDGCSACRYKYLCGGGCRARSKYATGSLHSRDSYCAMTMEFYDCLGAAMKASLEQRQQQRDQQEQVAD